MQPFWTSKTFWVMILGLVFNVLTQTGVISADLDVQTITNGVLLILGIVFRWQADGRLSVTKPKE